MEGESAEQYLLVLHALARNCDNGQLRDELIRGRIVIGILDKALSKRLQLDPGLTLEKAARMVRQSESVGEQQRVLKGQKDGDKEGVDALDEFKEKGGAVNKRIRIHLHPVPGVEISMKQGSVQLRK